MDCKQINEVLMDYLYQELQPAQVERFEAHLQHCPGCTELIGGFEQTRSAFIDMPEEDPPAAVSAFLLREASRAAAPPKVGFWEQLRLGVRAMVMHPAMTVATTMVLVVGVSFYIYKQGPMPGSKEMMDAPLIEEEHSLDPGRTAAIGVQEREKPAASKAAPSLIVPTPEPSLSGGEGMAPGEALAKKEAAPIEQKALAQAQPVLQGGGYKELAKLDKKAALRGGAGGASVSAKTAGYEDNDNGLDDLASNAIDMPRRDRAEPLVAAKPAAPAPVTTTGTRANAQLAKRTEKSAAKGWGGKAAGAVPADESVASGAIQVASAPRPRPKTKPSASPQQRPRPSRARRASSSADKNKEKDALGSLDFWKKGGGRKLGEAESAADPAPAKAPPPPAANQEADDQEEQQPRQSVAMKKAPKKKAANRRPSGRSQSESKSDSSAAQTFLEQGHLAADSGICRKAYEYYNKALGLQPGLKTNSSLVARVQRCAGLLAEQGNEAPIVAAQKKYSRLSSLLEREIKRSRESRIAAKRRAKLKKKASSRKAKSRQKKKAAPSSKAAY